MPPIPEINVQWKFIYIYTHFRDLLQCHNIFQKSFPSGNIMVFVKCPVLL